MIRARLSKPPSSPGTVTGVHLMQGHGVAAAKGFWTEAWSQVVRRPGAIFGLTWVGIVTFFACYAPIVANGHPIWLRETAEGGRAFSPLFESLSGVDLMLLVGPLGLLPWAFLRRDGHDPGRWVRLAMVLAMAGIGVALASLVRTLAVDLGEGDIGTTRLWGAAVPAAAFALGAGAWCVLARGVGRDSRFAAVFFAAIQTGVILIVTTVASSIAEGRDAAQWIRDGQSTLPGSFAPMACTIVAVLVSAVFLAIPTLDRVRDRLPLVAAVGVMGAVAATHGWSQRPANFDYIEREAADQVEAYYTVIPWSPTQRSTRLHLKDPGERLSEAMRTEPLPSGRDPRFLIGTDSLGQDVLSQMLHASRLSISIGLVSTGIAVMIGVTLGSLMGYFGGRVDMVLYRVVEMFMAIPVLFLLIVAAGVLPRNTYIIMAIIGAVSWTGAARFVRAEFYKLRNQDFVQSARAVGLPLPSILFKHMLPNGVTPVLVDASFAIAVAILFESILSYLGLGPADQPSWGRLLSEAQTQVGGFVAHLAIVPGATITLTVLSFTLIGEALRDAIDPKLKKARV